MSQKETLFKFIAMNPGDTSVGIPATNLDIEIRIGDENFVDNPKEFIEAFRAFIAPWVDVPPKKIFTAEDLDRLSRENTSDLGPSAENDDPYEGSWREAADNEGARIAAEERIAAESDEG